MRRGRKKRAAEEAIGISRGGRNTKLHAISDMQCRPLALYLTQGQRADIKGAVALSGALPPVKYLLADKAYDAGYFRGFLLSRNIEPVIPAKSNRKIHIPHDRERYKHRNVVERMFGRIKDWRRVATRYDKLARNFFAAVCLASLLCFWI
jgi:transposase